MIKETYEELDLLLKKARKWGPEFHDKCNDTYKDGPMKYHLDAVYSQAILFEKDLISHLSSDKTLTVEEIGKEVLCTQIACYLHDVLEDTWASYNDVKDNFNTRIADLVYLVTDELGKNRTERALKTYPKIRTDASAVYIKLCDRISNVQEAIVHGPLDMGKAYLKQHETFRYALYKEGEFEKLWNFYFELIDKLTEILEGDNAINS